jgi:hypothetical protein
MHSILRKPSTDAPTTPLVEKSPTPETIQQNLSAGRTAADVPAVAEAQAWLTAAVPAADAGIARREAWRNAPMVPRPGDDFPPHANVDALLDLANAQTVSDPEVPAGLAEPFTKARADVSGFVADIPRAQSAKAAIPTLQPKDCQRADNFRLAGH